MKMIVRAQRIVQRPQEKLFNMSQNYMNRLSWDPFLRDAVLIGQQSTPDVGVSARCVARSGLAMTARYVSYSPPRVAAIRMTAGPLIFRHFAASWRFESIDEESTMVTFTCSFATWPRQLRMLLDPVVSLMLRAVNRRRLSAFARAAESQQEFDRVGPQPDQGIG